jgi:hypothetical protein
MSAVKFDSSVLASTLPEGWIYDQRTLVRRGTTEQSCTVWRESSPHGCFIRLRVIPSAHGTVDIGFGMSATEITRLKITVHLSGAQWSNGDKVESTEQLTQLLGALDAHVQFCCGAIRMSEVGDEASYLHLRPEEVEKKGLLPGVDSLHAHQCTGRASTSSLLGICDECMIVRSAVRKQGHRRHDRERERETVTRAPASVAADIAPDGMDGARALQLSLVLASTDRIVASARQLTALANQSAALCDQLFASLAALPDDVLHAWYAARPLAARVTVRVWHDFFQHISTAASVHFFGNYVWRAGLDSRVVACLDRLGTSAFESLRRDLPHLALPSRSTIMRARWGMEEVLHMKEARELFDCKTAALFNLLGIDKEQPAGKAFLNEVCAMCVSLMDEMTTNPRVAGVRIKNGNLYAGRTNKAPPLTGAALTPVKMTSQAKAPDDICYSVFVVILYFPIINLIVRFGSFANVGRSVADAAAIAEACARSDNAARALGFRPLAHISDASKTQNQAEMFETTAGVEDVDDDNDNDDDDDDDDNEDEDASDGDGDGAGTGNDWLHDTRVRDEEQEDEEQEREDGADNDDHDVDDDIDDSGAILPGDELDSDAESLDAAPLIVADLAAPALGFNCLNDVSSASFCRSALRTLSLHKLVHTYDWAHVAKSFHRQLHGGYEAFHLLPAGDFHKIVALLPFKTLMERDTAKGTSVRVLGRRFRSALTKSASTLASMNPRPAFWLFSPEFINEFRAAYAALNDEKTRAEPLPLDVQTTLAFLTDMAYISSFFRRKVPLRAEEWFVSIRPHLQQLLCKFEEVIAAWEKYKAPTQTQTSDAPPQPAYRRYPPAVKQLVKLITSHTLLIDFLFARAQTIINAHPSAQHFVAQIIVSRLSSQLCESTFRKIRNRQVRPDAYDVDQLLSQLNRETLAKLLNPNVDSDPRSVALQQRVALEDLIANAWSN